MTLTQKEDGKSHLLELELLLCPKIKQGTAIFVGQGTTKYCKPQISKSQYLSDCLRYGLNFFHLIINFKCFKITFSSIKSYTAPSFLFGGCVKMTVPEYSSESKTLPLTGLPKGHEWQHKLNK